ncbi:MAG: hypothetical protein OXG43_07085 [Chloroflexi bacterium]|nr:hypothetical protein [Chloroflexota bacterium]
MESLSAVNIATVIVIVCSLAAVIAASVYQWSRHDPIDDLLHRVRKQNR